MNDDNKDFDFESMMNRAERHWNKLYDQMNQLRSDPCMTIPKVGDLVIVAGGPLGMGHAWIRLEAEVLHVASTSYKIRIHDRPKFLYPLGYQDMWIDPVLVLDVISKEYINV